MDPQCHPKVSHCQHEEDLLEEQDEFFLSGAQNCVECVSFNLNSNDKESYDSYKTPSVAVLNEVIERTELVKEIRPPTMKPAPTLPRLFKKDKEQKEKAVEKDGLTVNSADPISVEDNEVPIVNLKEQISLENEKKLAAMDSDEIAALKEELFESVPESFLNTLRNKH